MKFITIGIIFVTFFVIQIFTIVCNPKPGTPINTPMGKERGVYPGRVVWSHEPDATSWNGKREGDGYWWEPKNTNQEVVTKMLEKVMLKLTESNDLKESWRKVFEYFNRMHNNESVGYKNGEKIVIKLNFNGNAYEYSGNNGNQVSPQFVKALTRQMVYYGGVKQEDITFYDAARLVTRQFNDEPTGIGKEFPFVNWRDNQGGQEYVKAVERDDDTFVMLSDDTIHDQNKTRFPRCATEAKYMINVANFRGHDDCGMYDNAWKKSYVVLSYYTTFSDFGSVYRADCVCSKSHGIDAGHSLHDRSYVRDREMNTYNPIVDLMGHKKLNGKGLLYLSDGLYGGPMESNLSTFAYPIHFAMAPFNDDWTSSIFASLDPVALDSVAFDFIRNEPNIPYGRIGCVDNYLHEEALANDPPSGTIYTPDGVNRLDSLGVHEHWNNADPSEMKYSRNLGKDYGIEFIKVSIN